MNIFITGIDGMLGYAIAQLHMKAGDNVSGCDIWPDTSPIERGDIRYLSRLREMVSPDTDRIYHCAAMLGVQNTENYPEVCRQINEQGTDNVVTVAREVGAELVFLSSSEVYGDQAESLHENSPLLGDNVYALSKQYGENIILSGLDPSKVTICRMFNCYGPRQVRQFFIPKIISLARAGWAIPLYGNPENKRSYLFSYDAARHIMDVAASPSETPKIVNVAHPQTLTLLQAATHVIEQTHSRSKITVMEGGERYEDRDVKRDIPNRLAEITRLGLMSKHKPSSFKDALSMAIHTHDTTRGDWSYAREVV